MAGSVYIGNLTPQEKVMAYNAIVEEGFQAAFDRPQDLVYTKIAATKTPKEMGVPNGAVPTKTSFGFSPPNGGAEELTAAGRHSRPLSMHSIEVVRKIFTDTLHEDRAKFEEDVLGILKKVPRDLRRTEQKNPDKLLAQLFREGKTRKDYRGENFWATGKVCSPEGNVPDTFRNLYTNTPLTARKVAEVMQEMMGIKGPDGLTLGVRPDTLVIPFSLTQDATIATELKQIVFSATAAGVGANIGHIGQATGVGYGDNVMTVLKWVKNIVVFDLLQDGQAINNTSWYILDCSSGPMSFCYALFQEAEYVSLMDPRDPNVFWQDRYYWGYRKAEGVAYGLPQFAARCEQ